MTRTTKVAIVAAITFWASAFVGIRAGLQGYTPEGLALLRYLVASAVMTIVYFYTPNRDRINHIDKIYMLLTGALGIGVYNLTLNYGELAVSSGVASFITSQSPVMTTIFAVMFLGEKLTTKRVLGFMVSMVGVVVIAYGEIGKFELTPGIMYVLAAMIAGSCFSIMQKPLLKKYNAIQATAYVMWGGTLFLLMYVSHLQYDISHASLGCTAIVVYLGIFPAALAYVAWSYTLKRLAVSHAVSYFYILPFVTALMGWLFLGEVPALISLLGAVIAIGGVWLVNQSYRSVKKPAPLIEVQVA
jgi:drug/metabolite transporter (DMT)-like permease